MLTRNGRLDSVGELQAHTPPWTDSPHVMFDDPALYRVAVEAVLAMQKR